MSQRHWICSASCPILLLFFVLCLLQVPSSDAADNFQITFSPPNFINVTSESVGSIFFNITSNGTAASSVQLRNLTFSVRTDRTLYLRNFSVLSMEDGSLSGQIDIVGRRLGWTYLTMSYINDKNVSVLVDDGAYQLVCLRESSTLQEIYRYFLIGFVILLVFSMGCAVSPPALLKILKRPTGLVVGWISQFILMPHIGLGVGQLLQLVPGLEESYSFAFGMLTMGCSPGGGSSNMWTFLYGGDLDLSMTMTFISQICALFMLPLWLFVYGRLYLPPDNSIRIPFENIALNLLQLVIPVGLGVLVRIKFPKIADVIVKIIKPFAFVFILYVIAFGTYVNLYMFELIGDFPILIPFSAMLPWFGFLSGFVFSKLICRLSFTRAVAISMETGIQNVGIPMQILLFSMPSPHGELGAIVPLLIVLLTPFPLYTTLLGRTIYRRCCRDGEEPTPKKYELDEDETQLDTISTYTQSTEVGEDRKK